MRDGMPDIPVVPMTGVQPRCALCAGRGIALVLDQTQEGLNIKSYPCPVCQPLWWRERSRP